MIKLEQTKEFPTNSEWAYLYAIADIYDKYSYFEYQKEYNLYSPHPLKDYEVIQILKEKYNLIVHRNTVTNNIRRLEQYFGYKFKTNRKGKYIDRDSKNNDMLLIDAALAVSRSNLFSNEDAKKIISFLSSLANNPMSKNQIEHNKRTRINNRPKIDEDIKNKIKLITTAIERNRKISFTIFGLTMTNCKPIGIKTNAQGDVLLEYESIDDQEFQSYKLSLIKDLIIRKPGRPKKKNDR